MKPSILVVLLLLLRHILLLLPRRRRLVSLVAIKDLFLTVRFLFHGLRPITIHTASASASLHMWVPLARSNKPPLLLLHGFGSDARWTWEGQVATLSRAFDLYIPNLVFFGGSTSDSPDRSIAFQSKCIAEAMARLGVNKYTVAGLSYGGFVAFRMAAEEAAEEVERVVVLTSGVCATPKELRELVEREGRDVSEILLPTTAEELRRLVRASMHKPPAWMPDFFLMDFIEAMYLDQRKERIELLRELLDKGANADPLPVLAQETLILWGDKDQVFPINFAYRLQRHLGEKSRVEIIKDAGHALQLEKADQVNQAIKSFITGANASKWV